TESRAVRKVLEFHAVTGPPSVHRGTLECAAKPRRDGASPRVQSRTRASRRRHVIKDVVLNAHPPVRLGLRANVAQFTLLVIVNAFVGAMIGMERSILPAIAEQDFHLVARTAVLSFIVVFGVTKALTNYAAGRLAERVGRKQVLVAGWAIAIPVPFLLMWAPQWKWILAANALLGISQGLTW